jgi:hypothetical protein
MSAGSWLRQEIPPPFRQRCHRLRPMRPGHAGDNYCHVVIHLTCLCFSVWRAAGDLTTLITANHRNDRECSAQTSGKDPQT